MDGWGKRGPAEKESVCVCARVRECASPAVLRAWEMAFAAWVALVVFPVWVVGSVALA